MKNCKRKLLYGIVSAFEENFQKIYRLSLHWGVKSEIKDEFF